MIKQTLFLSLALFAILSSSSNAQLPLCERMARQCDFYLKGHRNDIPVLNLNSKPDKSMHGKKKAIMSKRPSDGTVHIVNSNGRSAEFVFDFNAFPLPQFPPTDSNRYVPTHFKTYTITNSTYSGIGHQTFTRRQRLWAGYRCVRLFISEYQTVVGGMMMNKANNPPSNNDCIVFKTRTGNQ